MPFLGGCTPQLGPERWTPAQASELALYYALLSVGAIFAVAASVASAVSLVVIIASAADMADHADQRGGNRYQDALAINRIFRVVLTLTAPLGLIGVAVFAYAKTYADAVW